jgi:hypothetical protein
MPSELNTSKTFFLISAIVNILILLGWGGTTVLGGIATCGIGCLLGALPILNLVSCILDFMAYSKLNSMNQPGTAGTMKNAAIMDIVTVVTGNVVSLIFGILILQYLNSPSVDNYLKERNIY